MEVVTSASAARKSSGLTMQECADIMGMSLPTYRKIEEDDSNMSLGNIESILPHMNDISRKILKDRINEIFLRLE